MVMLMCLSSKTVRHRSQLLRPDYRPLLELVKHYFGITKLQYNAAQMEPRLFSVFEKSRFWILEAPVEDQHGPDGSDAHERMP
jgi:hypothetical protein